MTLALRELQACTAALRQQCGTLAARMHALELQLSALRRPLKDGDEPAARLLLPVLPTGVAMPAVEVRMTAYAVGGDAGAALRQALVPFIDADGGHRRLGKLLVRCAGHPFDGRMVRVFGETDDTRLYEVVIVAPVFAV